MPLKGKKAKAKASKNGAGRNKSRSSRQLDAIVPGVGQSPPSAFASNGTSRKGASAGRKGSKPLSLACWDGLSPVHLSLPRAIGPYTVIRLTSTFTTNDPFVMIGTFLSTSEPGNMKYGGNAWSKTCAVSLDHTQLDKSIQPSGTGHQAQLAAYEYDTMSGLDTAQVVPSAITVQVMNTNSLQQTSGLLYAGIVKTLVKEQNSDVTPNKIGQNFITTQAPRLTSLPKLALRGVKVQSMPMNMNRLSDFLTFSDDQNGQTAGFAWGHVSASSNLPAPRSLTIDPAGFAPIIFYRPDDPAVIAAAQALTYQVTTEFRCRFDLMNVAASTHRHHKVSSDSTWDRLMTIATAAGHGVLDIADSAAVRGAVYNAAQGAAMAALA